MNLIWKIWWLLWSLFEKNVLLLADVFCFQKFTSESLTFYKLDPSHYFSFPELSWNAMSKTTGVKLKLISNIEKYLFIKQGLQGGICDLVKQITNTWKIMIPAKNVNS